MKLGQPLMKIDRADLDLAIAARDKDVEAARATAVQARADEARYRKLLAMGGRRISAMSRRRPRRHRQGATRRRRGEARVAEKRGDLFRPGGGRRRNVIVETLGEPGQVVSAGQTVVRLAQAGPREAVVALPETIRPAIGSDGRG